MAKNARKAHAWNRSLPHRKNIFRKLSNKIGRISRARIRTPAPARRGRSPRAAKIVGVVSLVVALGSCAPAVDTSADDTSEPELSRSGTLFAPYLYLDSAQRPTLTELADQTGQHSFVLAFVLAGPGRCSPSWNSLLPVDDRRLVAEVAQLRERGGDIVVATGGASGAYLENACDSADALAAAYGQALDAVGSNHLDVDIEADIPVDLVNRALAVLQRDRGTTVTYTLQVENATEGLTQAAMNVLHNAAGHQLDVIVNAMLMNFDYTGDWNSAMVAAAESTVRQMGEIWPDEDAAALRGRLGITTMIGRNDMGMVTTLSDAHTLADYAGSNNIAYVGFWSVTRDNGGCPGQRAAAAACSGVDQEPYEFIGIFQDLAAERTLAPFPPDEVTRNLK